MSEVPEIPEQIKDLMLEDEIENMKNFRGWSVGVVKELNEDGEVVDTIKDAWIEIFDGEGKAGKFDGVRFMAIHEDEYEEAYAHESRDYLERRISGERVGEAMSVSGSYPAYVIDEYTHGNDLIND